MGTALCEITERPSVHAQGATNGGDEITAPLVPQSFIELGDKSGETGRR